MEKLKLDKNNLKKFGVTIGFVFFIITLLILIRQKYILLPTSIASLIFFILALIKPTLLKPIYIIWMKFAFVLAWVNTRLIIFVIFYLVFTPIGLAMRLFRMDLLDRKIDNNKESYWKGKAKKEFSPLDYERQF